MPNKKETIVFLDFCGTCVPFQSAPRYIDYTIAHYPRRIAKWRRKAYRLLEKFNLAHRIARWSHGLLNCKEMELRALKGYKEEVLIESAQSFYSELIEPNLIPEMMAVLKKHQEEGAHIVLVSGGFGIYLKYFAADMHIAPEDIISSNIQIKRGKATGHLDGLDCMEGNKVKLLESRFDKSQIYSIAYSDSYSDLPLFRWVDKGVVVAQIPTWNEEHGLDIIYWRK